MLDISKHRVADWALGARFLGAHELPTHAQVFPFVQSVTDLSPERWLAPKGLDGVWYLQALLGRSVLGGAHAVGCPPDLYESPHTPHPAPTRWLEDIRTLCDNGWRL